MAKRLRALNSAVVVTLIGCGAISANAGSFYQAGAGGDVSSGVSSTKTYTHAVDLNRGGGDTAGGNDALPLVINGVTFHTGGTTGPDAIRGNGYTLDFQTPAATFDGNGGNSTQHVQDLLDDFFYDGGSPASAQTLTLNNLTPGQNYITSFYVGGFQGANQTISTDDGSGATLTTDRGGPYGRRIMYAFTAPASGNITYSFAAANNADAFHQYGFTNEKGLPISDLFSTGIAADKTRVADRSNDPHYTVVTAPGGVGTGPARVVPDDGFPIGAWLGNDTADTSKWIGPSGSDDDANGGAGVFTYQTTFTLPANTDLSKVLITGEWSADDADAGLDVIRLNGVQVSTGNGGFSSYTEFSLNSGFQVGTNTLQFDVSNGGGPTGLRVSMFGTYDVTVPEPSVLGIAAIGILGGLARGRRVK